VASIDPHPETLQDKDGRLYDPRKGLGGYYRYGPRSPTPTTRKPIGPSLMSAWDNEIAKLVCRRIEVASTATDAPWDTEFDKPLSDGLWIDSIH
jgi:hypothetical protein